MQFNGVLPVKYVILIEINNILVLIGRVLNNI